MRATGCAMASTPQPISVGCLHSFGWSNKLGDSSSLVLQNILICGYQQTKIMCTTLRIRTTAKNQFPVRNHTSGCVLQSSGSKRQKQTHTGAAINRFAVFVRTPSSLAWPHSLNGDSVVWAADYCCCNRHLATSFPTPMARAHLPSCCAGGGRVESKTGFPWENRGTNPLVRAEDKFCWSSRHRCVPYKNHNNVVGTRFRGCGAKTPVSKYNFWSWYQSEKKEFERVRSTPRVNNKKTSFDQNLVLLDWTILATTLDEAWRMVELNNLLFTISLKPASCTQH